MKNDPIFEQKKNHAIAIMKAKRMWRSIYAPPCHIFLWKLGIRVAPPPFSPFLTNFLCFTGIYTPFWGVVMWFVFWGGVRKDFVSALEAVLTVGVLFGLSAALLELWQKKANHLPPWSQV